MRNQALARRDDDNVVAFPGSPGPQVDESGVDIAKLFDEHAPYLCRVVQRLTGSAEAAEDVVQEVFLLAYGRRDELEDRTGIRTWLYRVAVNHVRHRRRSYARYQGLLERYRAQPLRDDPVGPDESVDRIERGKMIQECVLHLSDKQREVFVLYELEELEGTEIAEVLGIPVNTVWSRLRLARNAFRDQWTRTVEVEAR